MGLTATSTFRQASAVREPSIVVGWASGVVDVWPQETDELIQPTLPLRARACTTAADPETVLELLAAVEGIDAWTYGRRHLAEAGAILALTNHTVAAILAAAAEVDDDELRPSAVLAVLHGTADLHEHVDVEIERSPLTRLLAS
jgi:hypothetical protein